ncbi:MAG: 3-isopropylmalate dehydratase small subunit [Arenibacterium sp.]
MTGWEKHEGVAVTLAQENVDTDQLIPARFMSVPRSEGYGDYLLHDLRRDKTGALRTDLSLNQTAGASVLIAGRNFGCGSSREAAVYALVDAGFCAVVAPSFGDIFAGNAVNNGLLPAQVSDATIKTLIAEKPGTIHIDLKKRVISVNGATYDFDLDDTRQMKLIKGWDDIDLTRAEDDGIGAYRSELLARRPWLWPKES